MPAVPEGGPGHNRMCQVRLWKSVSPEAGALAKLVSTVNTKLFCGCVRQGDIQDTSSYDWQTFLSLFPIHSHPYGPESSFIGALVCEFVQGALHLRSDFIEW